MGKDVVKTGQDKPCIGATLWFWGDLCYQFSIIARILELTNSQREKVDFCLALEVSVHDQ